jgi:mono/diheme cytochrome c family protein
MPEAHVVTDRDADEWDRGKMMTNKWVVGLVLGLAACAPQEPADPVEQGRRVYVANCIACHHNDPAREGSIGPAVAGSSRELLEARILRAEYPPAYTPKRPTALMQAMPYLKGDIDALAAYLGGTPALGR